MTVAFSIVTVLHQSAPELPRLLRSIDAHLHPRPQIVAVDSGSTDGGPELARESGAEVIVLDGNPGFGAANNAGVQRAAHEVTALLNPDCELPDGGLAELATRAAAADALLVPRLLDADGSPQRSAHPLPGRPASLLRAALPGPLLPQPHRARRARAVGWAIAACLVARTDLLRRLGPFDPGAFLFYEDLDLCLRARAAGVPTVLHPDVRLRHLGGRSTQRAFGREPFEQQARRRREVIVARLGRRALLTDDAAQALTFGLRASVGRDRDRNVAALNALRAARRG
ncbi:MAG: N-acetylglucosaminyl-diphospho-decaprenol L-rhamnosyltransferase [Solirubrobacteraceae bacterium]